MKLVELFPIDKVSVLKIHIQLVQLVGLDKVCVHRRIRLQVHFAVYYHLLCCALPPSHKLRTMGRLKMESNCIVTPS